MKAQDLVKGDKVRSTYMGNAVVIEVTEKQIIFSTPDRRSTKYRNTMSNSVTRVSKSDVTMLLSKGYLVKL